MVATSSRKPKHGIVTVEKAPQSRGTGEQKPGGGETEEKTHPQASAGQIPDPGTAAPGGTAGQLRHQQFRQRKENGGGEHHDGKDHAAEHTVIRQGIDGAGVQGQPPGHQQIFRGGQAGPEVIGDGQGQGGPQYFTVRRTETSVRGGGLPSVQNQKKGQRQDRGGGGRLDRIFSRNTMVRRMRRHEEARRTEGPYDILFRPQCR